jgi:outer membrane protein OmpA-like peptidoglycan-associated protein
MNAKRSMTLGGLLLQGLLLGLLGGCMALGDRGSYAELEQKTRGYDGTAASLLEDTDDPALARFLEQAREDEARLEETIRQLQAQQRIDPLQALRMREIHQSLRQLQLEKTRAILEAYHEFDVEFVHLNNTQLLPAARQSLQEVPWERHCAGQRRILVYGYGDPIGGQEATERVSQGRAASVAAWLARQSACARQRILARGLGVDVKAEEIQNAPIPEAEKLRLYEKSRYARILVPK